MTPNQVTLVRIGAAFAAVALFSAAREVLAADLAAVVLTITAIALDGVDGYIARRRGLATPLGAQLDILGDRVVENLFFTCFAVSGLISLWVPVVFFARGALTDFLRGAAARAGRTGFAGDSMLETWWGKTLVASRASRAAYAALKCVCFCYLGLLLPLRGAGSAISETVAGSWPASWLSSPVANALFSAGRFLTGATVLFCLIRAFPVVWEGRRYLATENPPRKSLAVPVIR
ncbi:MAG TPA: CDP-alcohol phosphatidyltransferase family protein [Candidatus Baltobacteraceae bacterium]|nr:CDP-alcohol phosphatidyltransferase family protein [Candidatus Baltobacteraceae bacterium]